MKTNNCKIGRWCMAAFALVSVGGAWADEVELTPVEITITAADDARTVTSTAALSDTLLKVDVEAGCTNVYSGKITGASRIEKRGMGVLRLTNGDNTFTGGITFYEGEIWAEAEGCLGTGAVTYRDTEDKAANKRCLDFRVKDATFANTLNFINPGNPIDSVASRCQITFTENTHLTGAILGPDTYTDPFICIGGKKDTRGYGGNRPTPELTVDGDISVPNSRFKLVAYGTMVFNGKIKAAQLNLSQNSSSQGWLFFNNSENEFGSSSDSYDPYVFCGAKNCLSNVWLIAQYNFQGTYYNCLNMNGYDQVFRAFTYSPMDNDNYKTLQAPDEGTGMSVSAGDAPATLTLTGRGAGATDITQHVFIGPLSVVVNADPAYTLVLSNRTHQMTGTFTVSNGTVKAYRSTTFRQAAGFTVEEGAAFELTTDQANALQACRAITVRKGGVLRFTDANTSLAQNMGIHLVVSLEDGATLALPEGKNIICKSLVTNGVAVADGIYTSAEIPGLERGSLRVTDQYWPEEVEPVYAVTVAAGVTNRLDDLTISVRSGGVTTEKAMGDCTAADFTTGTFVKKGAGVLVSSTKLAQFIGQILIEGGAFLVDDNLQTGPQNATATATVWTRRGASFGFIGTDKTCGQNNLKLYNAFHFAGTGLDGQGVVLNLLAVQQSYVFNSNCKWYVDEDILIRNIPGYAKRWDWSGPQVAFQGNTITWDRCAESGWTFYVNAYRGTLSAGKMIFRGMTFHVEGGLNTSLGEETPIVLEADDAGNGASVGFYNSDINITDYHIQLAKGQTAAWNVNGSAGETAWTTWLEANRSYWGGPVTINGQMNAYSSVSHRGLMIKGKLSGEGTFTMKDGLFKLYRADNDFTGDIAVWSSDVGNKNAEAQWAALMLWRNGALPLGCRSVAVTNAPVYLVNAGTYDLPAIQMMVPATTNIAFYGAATDGTLAGLVKQGPGVLNYEVPLSITGRLEVTEGTFKPKSGSVTVGELAMGGGTIDGDVTVTRGLRYSAAAVANGTAGKTTITGTLSFGAEADAIDFEELATTRALTGRKYTIAEAAGGVTGLTQILAPEGSAARAKGWRVESDGEKVYLIRALGTTLIIR